MRCAVGVYTEIEQIKMTACNSMGDCYLCSSMSAQACACVCVRVCWNGMWLVNEEKKGETQQQQHDFNLCIQHPYKLKQRWIEWFAYIPIQENVYNLKQFHLRDFFIVFFAKAPITHTNAITSHLHHVCYLYDHHRQHIFISYWCMCNKILPEPKSCLSMSLPLRRVKMIGIEETTNQNFSCAKDKNIDRVHRTVLDLNQIVINFTVL